MRLNLRDVIGSRAKPTSTALLDGLAANSFVITYQKAE